MNYTTAIFLISDEVKMHAVIFSLEDNTHHPTRYDYKTFDKDLQVGNYVVVPSSVEKGGHGMSVAQIVELEVEVDFDSNHRFKWIVGSISLENFEGIKVKEEEAISAIRAAEKTRKRKELKKDLMDDAGEELKRLGYDTRDPDNATDIDSERTDKEGPE